MRTQRGHYVERAKAYLKERVCRGTIPLAAAERKKLVEAEADIVADLVAHVWTRDLDPNHPENSESDESFMDSVVCAIACCSTWRFDLVIAGCMLDRRC